MAKYYDKNLQLINNLDIHLNIYKTKTLKMSVLRNFANDLSKTSNTVYDDSDLEMVCEALQFLDINIINDLDDTQGSVNTCPAYEPSHNAASQVNNNNLSDNNKNKSEDSPKVSDSMLDASGHITSTDIATDKLQHSGQKSASEINSQGINYNSIKSELDQLLHPKKLDFSQLAATRSSAELCQLILDNPENYLKVMYAISKQL